MGKHYKYASNGVVMMWLRICQLVRRRMTYLKCLWGQSVFRIETRVHQCAFVDSSHLNLPVDPRP